MVTNGGDGFQSEINVTPLVDVVLVLLIIFMVTVPLTLRGYDVDIPAESNVVVEQPQQDTEQLVLGIDLEGCPIVEPPSQGGLPGDCQVRLNDDEIAVSSLADRIGEIFEPRPADKRVLFLSAEAQLNYEGVMRILDLAKSGVEGLRIGMVTELEPDPGA